MLRMGRSNRPEESDQAARQAQAGQQATTPGATSGAQPTPAAPKGEKKGLNGRAKAAARKRRQARPPEAAE